MPAGFTVKIEGLEEVQAKYNMSAEVLRKHFKLAMEKSVGTVEANAKAEAPVDRGMLRGSIIGKVKTGAEIVGVIGPAIEKAEVYPIVMEYGRRPGKPPPYRPLVPWVRRVLQVPVKDEVRAAIQLARSIGRKGIKGRFYMRKGYEKSKGDIMRFFREALSRVAEEL